MEATLQPPSPIFTFDPNEHRYYLDGVEIPGVTSILKEVGLSQFWGGFTEAAWRGLHVHEAAELLDLNDLDWNSVYPKWAGYVHAYDRFKRDKGFVPELIEYQTYHPQFRFAGTIDRRGMLTELGERRVILDLKTGVEEDWHRWQTAGYLVLGGPSWALDRRGDLYLHEDGTYSPIHWHDDNADIRTFLSALTVTHTKWSQR